MKRIVPIFIFGAITLSVHASCRTNKDTSLAAPIKMENTYDAVISFFSIGQGVDYLKKQAFDKLLKDFEEKEKVSLTTESYPWGREGEVDVCIRFTGLSKKQQSALIAQIEHLIRESSLIRMGSNVSCEHKR
ncbi:MAG: hypothetical protein ACK5D8_10500 [Bacteroidota bacterium]